MNSLAIEIIDPGPLATVQDKGRFGYQHMGVPVSGAMDQWALRIGNLLVGNSDNGAAVEITMGGFICSFLQDTFFTITGPGESASLNGASIAYWQPVTAARGDLLVISGSERGMREYLCLAGGVDVPEVLGSRSTYLRGKFGGFGGRALRRGDALHTGQPSGRIVQKCPLKLIPVYQRNPVVRIVKGPQEDSLSPKGWKALLGGTYRMTDRTDRMGCVLQGPMIEHEKSADIISDGIALGSIQVPGNGQPMVLMADRPTTGGYAKPATLASFDVPLIAQASVGEEIRFRTISLLDARETYLKQEYHLRKFFALSPVR